jgi:hypothetical protein
MCSGSHRDAQRTYERSERRMRLGLVLVLVSDSILVSVLVLVLSLDMVLIPISVLFLVTNIIIYLVVNKEINYMNTAADVMSNYKYALSFENSQVDGYVTEKLATPLLGILFFCQRW